MKELIADKADSNIFKLLATFIELYLSTCRFVIISIYLNFSYSNIYSNEHSRLDVIKSLIRKRRIKQQKIWIRKRVRRKNNGKSHLITTFQANGSPLQVIKRALLQQLPPHKQDYQNVGETSSDRPKLPCLPYIKHTKLKPSIVYAIRLELEQCLEHTRHWDRHL